MPTTTDHHSIEWTSVFIGVATGFTSHNKRPSSQYSTCHSKRTVATNSLWKSLQNPGHCQLIGISHRIAVNVTRGEWIIAQKGRTPTGVCHETGRLGLSVTWLKLLVLSCYAIDAVKIWQSKVFNQSFSSMIQRIGLTSVASKWASWSKLTQSLAPQQLALAKSITCASTADTAATKPAGNFFECFLLSCSGPSWVHRRYIFVIKLWLAFFNIGWIQLMNTARGFRKITKNNKEQKAAANQASQTNKQTTLGWAMSETLTVRRWTKGKAPIGLYAQTMMKRMDITIVGKFVLLLMISMDACCCGRHSCWFTRIWMIGIRQPVVGQLLVCK